MADRTALPFSRLFAAPRTPFDTEVAVQSVGSELRVLADAPDVLLVVPEGESAPRFALLRGAATERGAATALEQLQAQQGPAWPVLIMVEKRALASQVEAPMREAGLAKADLCFWGVTVDGLTEGPRLTLEPLVGDDAWRAWAELEREMLVETEPNVVFNNVLLARSIEFKRKQQRDSPPIRRFIARIAGQSTPIGMIGYAPFQACDVGIGAPGPVVRLRDVGIARSQRRQGMGVALLRALAAQARDECGATQVLICGRAEGAPAALYRRAGAQVVDTCAMFHGGLRSSWKSANVR